MKKYFAFFVFALCYSVLVSAQDTEFPKGFIMHLRLHNGMQTQFNSTPDLYVIGAQVVEQATVIPGRLRAGVAIGAFYTNKKMNALIGPTVSLKIKSFRAGPFGTAGNVQLNLEQLWGSDDQHLFGGGVYLDLLNKIMVGLTAHRDYELNNWWLQTVLAFRLSKTPKVNEPFNRKN
jgi:hypothetical protein